MGKEKECNVVLNKINLIKAKLGIFIDLTIKKLLFKYRN